MSKSVLELAVETGQWDAGLKKGQRSLDNFIKDQGGLQQAMDKNGDKLGKFIQMMGKMDSTASTARQQANEYRQSLERLQSISSQLSGEQKKLADEAIARLSNKFREAKSQADSFNSSINDGKGVLDQLSGKFGVSVKSITAWGAALGAAKVALDVAKDAFLASETNVDEWGRTIEGAQGAYNAFCQALNNSDLGNFFSNMESIIQRARDAYDALDKLKTNTGIISNREAQMNAQRAKYQKIIKDPNASQAEKDAARAGLANIQKQRAGATRETMDLNNDYIKKALREQLSTLTDAEYKRLYPLIVQSLYDTSAAEKLNNTTVTHGKKVVGAGKYARTVDNNINVGALLTDQFRESLNPYIQQYWNSYGRMFQDERADNRIVGARGGGGGGGNTPKATKEVLTGPLVDLEKQLEELKKAQHQAAAPEDWGALQIEIDKLTKKIEEFKGKVEEIPSLAETLGIAGKGADLAKLESIIGVNTDDGMKTFTQGDHNFEKGMNDAGKRLAKDGETAEKAWSAVADAIGTVGSALSMIEDPAVKVMAIVAEAIANIALTFAKSLKGTMTPWDWVAGATAGTATMISTIAAIKSATEYHAEGGIVGMNSLSRGTDVVPAMLTPGEVVLNASQQGALASRLSGGASQPYISGEMIYLGINNYLRRSGRGEIITAR